MLFIFFVTSILRTQRGRFRGIKESYYLKDNDADPDELFDEAIGFDDEEDEPSADVKSTSNLLLTEEDVLKAFDKPYIVKVAYDLPRDIKDRLQDQEFLNEEDEQAFVEEYYQGENFFTCKVVQDIVFFLRFAINPNDADAFMKIYYKCGYGFNQRAATWSCTKSLQKGISISDELINQLSQWRSLEQKASDFKGKMKRIAASAPQDAIDMICNYWYRDYAREKELDIGKCDILYSLAVQEKTITGFLERLELLPKLIENYHC